MSSAEKSRTIIVLGMHRSGTSALSRTINLLGIDLGNDFYQGPVNPRGYWEHEPVMRINDELLKQFLGFWTSPDPLPADWLNHNITLEAKEKLLEILRRDFGESPLWGLKDPRLCVLLPLYLSIFDELNVEPMFLHCIRNPVDVALSLQKRDQTEVEFSLVLWLRYVCEAFYHSYPYRNAFVSFDSLLSDWKASVTSIEKQLGHSWPNDIESSSASIEQYIEPSLRAFSNVDNALEGEGDIFEWITESYSLLKSICFSESCSQEAKRLLEIRNELDTALLV